ncbi:MAG: dTDP-4-dehydrorhamnose reductase [Methylovirgula sp.]
MSDPILIFGAGGQLGQEILAQAAAQGRDIVGLTRLEADVLDLSAVTRHIAETRPRLIVNAAAYTAVDKAESEAEAARLVNVLGAANVAGAAAAADVPLVHLSTDYVFDGSKRGFYVESDPVAPLGVYGRTKAEGEAAVRAAAPRHIILRTAWVYGRFGNNFLKTILRLAQERPELRVVADQTGCPTATQDLAEAIFAIDEAVRDRGAADWGTYHFAGPEATSWHGFAEAIVAAQARWTGLGPPVTAITTSDYPTPARRPLNSKLDSSRFAATFGYRAIPWRTRVTEAVRTLLQPVETHA